ncbi:MAG: succinate dehydrogenase, cytochrome b556 subunit [Pseudomonadota bacterium]|nr:succinate dehydrogenase, cytochrome b556 subunit [Pseudomonadota bacterium]MED5430057.1 succinate dehydrogenase, cytochrome b556 subunit [Pseudomonadota bacterium]
MKNSKRPLSPHLQVYKPQLTSVLSISHRIAGVILSGVSIIIPAGLYFFSFGENIFTEFLNFFNHYFFKFILIFLIFILSYHLFNGVRHLLWDLGVGLEIKESYLTGYLVIFLSFASTFALIFIF